MTEAYPLQWPPGKPRTPTGQQKRAAFKTSQDKAQQELVWEVQRLGGKNIVISTNIPIRRDGLPYSAKRIIFDQGVAVYFDYKGKQKCFACDRWDSIKDNMQGVRLTIQALRGIGRWGTGDMVEAAFTGFDALPPPMVTPARKKWWEVLNCHPTAPLDTVEAIYRELARSQHPDNGGTHEAMSELNAAIAEARKEKS